MIFVIAIGNKMRQGKTSLGVTLQAVLQSKGAFVQTFNFADSLKSIYRISEKNFETKNPARLQELAEEIKATDGEDVFAKDLVARIHDHYKAVVTIAGPDPHVVYIVSDLRHKAELEELQKFENKVFVRVEKTDATEEPDRDPNHRSETELDFEGWEDFQIKAANLDELKQAAAELVTNIFELGDDTSKSQ